MEYGPETWLAGLVTALELLVVAFGRARVIINRANTEYLPKTEHAHPVECKKAKKQI